MDAPGCPQHHALVRVLGHVKKLDDCFGQFLVRVICDCDACREIQKPWRALVRSGLVRKVWNFNAPHSRRQQAYD